MSAESRVSTIVPQAGGIRRDEGLDIGSAGAEGDDQMLVESAVLGYERLIHAILRQLPPHIRYAAQLGRVIVTSRLRSAGQLAAYEHGTRNLYVSPGISRPQLKKALYHEVAHALDDNFGVGHYFGESPHWVFLSKALTSDGPVEAFAAHMSEHLTNAPLHRRQAPVLAQFMDQALDHLKTHFG